MDIIFEDEAVTVVNKPAGLIVNEGETTKGRETVQRWNGERLGIFDQRLVGKGEFWDRSGLVHRLDKDTSGVMVLAKTEAAYDKLKMQFLERKISKKYTALVHGVMNDKEGVISAPIERHPNDRHKFFVGTDLSRTAITEWKTIRQWADFTLLELAPHTGRTHQIRVHLQHLHHPIVSDPIYGFKKSLKDDLVWCPRLFLHAKEIEFAHPTTGVKMKFEAALPLDLEQALEKLVH